MHRTFNKYETSKYVMFSFYMKSTGEFLLFSKHVLIFCPSYSDVPNRRLCMLIVGDYCLLLKFPFMLLIFGLFFSAVRLLGTVVYSGHQIRFEQKANSRDPCERKESKESFWMRPTLLELDQWCFFSSNSNHFTSQMNFLIFPGTYLEKP